MYIIIFLLIILAIILLPTILTFAGIMQCKRNPVIMKGIPSIIALEYKFILFDCLLSAEKYRLDNDGLFVSIHNVLKKHIVEGNDIARVYRYPQYWLEVLSKKMKWINTSEYYVGLTKEEMYKKIEKEWNIKKKFNIDFSAAETDTYQMHDHLVERCL